ncbi:hypothetical protein G7B21_28895 [Klebsiella pneumoniae]|nr:hypothetical protein [Klebsiella pneumoniae]
MDVVCTALAISLNPPIPVAITVAVRSVFGLGCWRPTGLGQRFAGGDQQQTQ